jgi:subtilase family serine protease
MGLSWKIVAPLAGALTIAACSGGSSTIPSNNDSVPQWQAKHLARAACPQVVNKPTCLVLISNRVGLACSPSSGACGWTPSDLQTRYGLTSYLGAGSGTKVAVIEAGDDNTAVPDLAKYRTEFGLGTATIIKYNEDGKEKDYPPNCSQYGWCLETALDIEMVSVSCPNCTIFLMEASSAISDFEKAEASAVKRGARILSNSWICYGSWDCGTSDFATYFEHKHVLYLASSGDDGPNEIGGPSVLGSVVAVGGTQLAKSGSTYSETLWSDAGGGCASPSNVGNPGVPAPAWQDNPDCTYRSDADISAEAGCDPGVAEYASQYQGWVEVCGTSVASPLSAGIFALAGNAKHQDAGEAFWETKYQADLFDVCGGSCLFSDYSYQGGWGSPNGIGAF